MPRPITRRLFVPMLASSLAVALLSMPAPRAMGGIGSDNTGWHRFQEDVTLAHPTGEGVFRLVHSDRGFTQLRLHIDGTSIIFTRITLLYEDGGQDQRTLKRYIRSGHDTPIIKLDNPDRTVRRVFFEYEIKQPDAGQPKQVVSLWTR